MSTVTLDRQPGGAPASTGGEFRTRGRRDGPSLTGVTDEQAAADPLTSPKTLHTLSFSTAEPVRIAVGANPGTPVTDLERMMNRGRAVRRAVLGNPSLPDRIAVAVARAARGDDLLVLRTNPGLSAVARALCTPATTAAPLVTVPPVEATLRPTDIPGDHRTIAADPLTAPQVLAALSLSMNEFVRNAVASNPGTPPHVLERLLSRGRFIRGLALRNPGLAPTPALSAARNPVYDDDLSNLSLNPTATTEILELCSHAGGMAPFRVAAHANTPDSVFTRYARSSNQQLLLAVAENSAAPAATREFAARRYTEIRDGFAAETAAAVAAEATRVAEMKARAAQRRRELRAEKRLLADEG